MHRLLSKTTLADWGELRFLRAVRERYQRRNPQIPLSMGDDAAWLKLKQGKDCLVTTDAMIEGTHFNFQWTNPFQLGCKAIAVNLSDLAAMGARPVAAFLSLGVPPETRVRDLDDFFSGLVYSGEKHGCALAGGDLVRAPIWMVNVTLIGEPAIEGRIVRRSTAKARQTVYVTGTLGDSAGALAALQRGVKISKAMRLRHHCPEPRVREAAALAEICPDLAMIDVSDGLVHDAGHLARESGVGIALDLAKLPITRDLREIVERLGSNSQHWALYGGEDYELLFATRVSREKIVAAIRNRGLDTPITAIGRVESGEGVALVDEFGKRLRPADRTYKHFA